MADKTTRWIIGCGSGCGVLVLIAVIIGVGATLKLRSLFEDIEGAKQSWTILVESQGDVADWTPPTDGHIPLDRLHVFLAARERMIAAQSEARPALENFPPDEFNEQAQSWRTLWKSMGAMGDLVPPLARYVEARHHILAELNMGPGEYGWIYTVAYHAWLGHDPGDGPTVVKDGHPDFGEPVFDAEQGSFGSQSTLIRQREMMMTLLGNWLRAVRADPDFGSESSMYRELTAEVLRLDADPGSMLWPEGIPAPVAKSLEPLRNQFLQTYIPHFNPFEYPLGNNWSWDQED
jgi:hypothetical protein